MRIGLSFLVGSAVLAGFVACATAEDDPPANAPPPADSAALPPSDGGERGDADVQVDSGVDARTCSEAGWCLTRLPDGDLMLKDIWPRAGRAFAVAESATLGVKVLEWRADDGAWTYIDDNSQNEVGGAYAAGIWAPDDDTVYYAASAGYVYRGTRRQAPETGWAWSRQHLDDNSHVGEASHATHDHGYPMDPDIAVAYPALGVWGIDAEHVYAWYSNTIYHWTGDVGGSRWVTDYVADDPDNPSEHLFFVSAAGANDEAWFAGVRQRDWQSSAASGNCALLVRKTADGFVRLADGVAGAATCASRADLPRIGGAEGWLTDIQMTGPSELTGMKAGKNIIRLFPDGVTLSVDSVPKFPSSSPGGNGALRSFWQSSSDQWLAGWGLVIRKQGSGDAGSYAISTVALNGSPIRSPMYRVRGTSENDLWATGNGYALHKTTP